MLQSFNFIVNDLTLHKHPISSIRDFLTKEEFGHQESSPHYCDRWQEISEGFKCNAERLSTVKGDRNALHCLEKPFALGPKHTETMAAEKANIFTHGNEE